MNIVSSERFSFPLCISSSFFLLSSFFFSSHLLSHPNSTLIFYNLLPQIEKEKNGKWTETDLEYKLASGKGGDPFSAHSPCSIHSERNLRAPKTLISSEKVQLPILRIFHAPFITKSKILPPSLNAQLLTSQQLRI